MIMPHYLGQEDVHVFLITILVVQIAIKCTVIKNLKFITKPQIVVNLSDFDIQSCTKANDLRYL